MRAHYDERRGPSRPERLSLRRCRCPTSARSTRPGCEPKCWTADLHGDSRRDSKRRFRNDEHLPCVGYSATRDERRGGRHLALPARRTSNAVRATNRDVALRAAKVSSHVARAARTEVAAPNDASVFVCRGGIRTTRPFGQGFRPRKRPAWAEVTACACDLRFQSRSRRSPGGLPCARVLCPFVHLGRRIGPYRWWWSSNTVGRLVVDGEVDDIEQVIDVVVGCERVAAEHRPRRTRGPRAAAWLPTRPRTMSASTLSPTNIARSGATLTAAVRKIAGSGLHERAISEHSDVGEAGKAALLEQPSNTAMSA